MHVPTQSVPTRRQAGASASLPLERGRGRGYARDGVVVYLGTRSVAVTEPTDRVLVIFIGAMTRFARNLLPLSTVVSRLRGATAGHE